MAKGWNTTNWSKVETKKWSKVGTKKWSKVEPLTSMYILGERFNLSP